jgi:GR25 family glycosyltransferase involved in LPS biosynthesis
MEAYIINLDERRDRWENCLAELNKCNLNPNRISALTPSLVDSETEQFASLDIIAIWKSHQNAMRVFLNSDLEYALILEDDFSLKIKDFNHLSSQFKKYELDFLQIGFLLPFITDYLNYKIENLQDVIFKLLSHLKFGSITSKHSINEQRSIPVDIVLNGIRAGGHAYIINRRFAKACLSMNTPTFLSTDGLFMALGVARNFRMARLRRSKVSQTNSPTSVTKRLK